MLLPGCLVQDAWKHTYIYIYHMINIKNQMKQNKCASYILKRQCSVYKSSYPSKHHLTSFPPKWTVPLLNNSRLMLSFRLMERYTWALYPSPATTALELTCHNFSDYLAGMVKIILRVGARQKMHTKTLHICLKCQLPLFGEASLNQIDGCFQQNCMHTVNQPLRVWLLPQLTELRWWLFLSGIDFPTISTYLWHHGPRKGRPPWYQRSCKSNLDRKHAEIVVDLYPSPGLPTKVPFRMAGAKQSHLKVGKENALERGS